MILAIKTDNPIMELYLLNASGAPLDQDTERVGNQLSKELLARIEKLLEVNEGGLEDMTGIIAYKGPGSFTGLRIGLTVANTLAYAQQIPVVGTTGETWLTEGISELKDAESGDLVMPEYGGEANITQPRK